MATDLAHVRFRGSHLHGALLLLPATLADVHPSRLAITPGGAVFDRQRGHAIRGAAVIEPPTPREVAPAATPKRRRRRVPTEAAGTVDAG